MPAGDEAAAQRPPLFFARRRTRAGVAAAGVALALAVAAPAARAPAEVIDGVAAAVGGEAIPRSEVDEAWTSLQGAPAPGPSAPASRAEVLSRLVDARVQLQKAREEGLEAKPEDVEEALKHIMADNGVHSLAELSTALAREGRTLEDLRRDVRDQITVLRLVQREVTAKLHVPTEELRAYYDAHPERFSTGRAVHVRQIVFGTGGLSESEAAKVARGMAALRGELTGRDAFRQAEARLAGTPGVLTGDAGTLSEAEVRPDLARVLFAMEPGQVSPPVALPNGVAVFLVESKDPGVPLPFDKALPEVRRVVTEQESMTRGAAWLTRLRRDAYVEVKGLVPAPDAAPAAPEVATPPPTAAPAPTPAATAPPETGEGPEPDTDP
jgi:peptidyl-prolyl cis-trans isomerase SurA